MPVGKSGMALLGDKGHVVTLGRKRIAAVSDTGEIHATVSFAAGETERTLFGYSPFPVSVRAVAGSLGKRVWDPATQLFSVTVRPAPGIVEADVHITQRSARSRNR